MNPFYSRTLPGLFLVAASLLLGAACGGGSGEGPTAPVGTTVAEVEYDSFQLANVARQDSNIEPPLDLDPQVVQVARAHSESMRDEDFFDHVGPNGGLGARLRAAGVSFSSAGENLALLSSVPSPAVFAHEQFLNSPEHRRVMLDARFRLAGVGVARSGDTYWLTQIYIKP